MSERLLIRSRVINKSNYGVNNNARVFSSCREYADTVPNVRDSSYSSSTLSTNLTCKYSSPIPSPTPTPD